MSYKIKCEVCGSVHKRREAYHKCYSKAIQGKKLTRGEYDEITGWVGADIHVMKLFRDCREEDYVEFDRKGRGDSLNHDLYAYDPSQGVAVIQARHAFRRYRNGYLSTHKTYFLAGYNEITNQPFRHPVSAAAVRGAIRANPDDSVAVVRAIQKWMWGVTEKQLRNSLRQGDILLLPAREKDALSADFIGTTYMVQETHEITADSVRMSGRIYALNPSLVHKKGQHAPVAMEGWASIRVAREVRAWDFAERLGD